jgi:hypothetical protein
MVVVGGGYDNVRGGVPWHDDGGWKPCEGVGYAFCVGGSGPGSYTEISIVAEGWTDIPAFDVARVPCFAHVGLLVNDNLGPRWGYGIAVIIRGAMHVGLGG